MNSELIIDEVGQDNAVRVTVHGEVDIYTSQKLKDRLYNIVDTKQKDLIIDCEGLNYIDSTGLGVFVGALKKAKQHDKKICITNLKDNIRKLFVITGLDRVFILE